MSKPISNSLSPNTEWDDVLLAIKIMLRLLRWKKLYVNLASSNQLDNLKSQTLNLKSATQKSKVELLKEEFKNYLEVKYAYSFNSGRSCLMAILYAIDIKEGDNVLIQAFTCNAVPNPIIWSGAKPVYVDIDASLNINVEDFEKKITPRSKAIIIQHTFGNPAKMDKIIGIAKKHNLFIIEDCAHSLGAQYNGRKIGTMGDISFFSFGRDKVISSVWGGLVATNNPEFAKRIEKFQEKLPLPSNFWIFRQLLHPIIFNLFILPFYNFFEFGKFLLVFLQRLNVLSKAVMKKEKIGDKPDYFPQKMPEALANLALHQFKKLEKFNNHRKKIAEFYQKNIDKEKFIPIVQATEKQLPNHWRYPVFTENPEEIAKKAKKNGILFDDGWRKSPVMPAGTDLEKMGYKIGSCPNAEKMADRILSLPTHINITEKDAQKIINFLNNSWLAGKYGNKRN